MTKLSLYLLILLIVVILDIVVFQSGVIILIAGLLLASLIITAVIMKSSESEQNRRKEIIDNGIETDGVVTEVHYLATYQSHIFYDFTDHNGKKYEISERIGWESWKYKKGQRVPVFYEKNNPQNCTIITGKEK